MSAHAPDLTLDPSPGRNAPIPGVTSPEKPLAIVPAVDGVTTSGAVLYTYKRAPGEMVRGEGVYLFDTEGKARQRDGPPSEVRQQRRRDRLVVGEEIALREARRGPQQLVEIRHAQRPPRGLDVLPCSAHANRRASSRGVTIAS